MGTRFQPVLPDPVGNFATAERVVFLSGKLYYDLVKEREAHGLDGRIAIIRLEELSPFPFQELHETLQKYTAAKEFFWIQEEPQNQGAWTHVQSRINSILLELNYNSSVTYHGRNVSPTPAPGVAKMYAAQQKVVLTGIFRDM